MAHITIVGMTTFTLKHVETGEIVEYTTTDLRCAQMLAAEDHSDDDEDLDAWVPVHDL